jgi:23S rRNA pseudouridine1911/1915/1917 synthase
VVEKGQVSVDGRLVREPGCLVEPGAVIEWDPNRRALPRARLSLPLLYGDEHLAVVDKPAGLLTVPSGPGVEDEDTALARVREYASHLHPRRPYAGVVHRIDRDTSGAVAFALSPPARLALRDLFRQHRIERRYLALVGAAPRAEKGTVDAPIRDAYEAGRRGVARGDESARQALTRWRLVERFAAGGALLEIELETGRQHQIRAHLAHIGMPILGDAVYGEGRPGPRVPVVPRRHMLHAQLLAFVHPITGGSVRAESPLPEDFARMIAALRRGRGSR